MPEGPKNGKKNLSFLIIIAIAIFILTIVLNNSTFLFPDYGADVYKTITVYTASIGILWLACNSAKVSLETEPWYLILVKFVPFYFLFNIGLTWVFTGTLAFTTPTGQIFTRELIISTLENIIIIFFLYGLTTYLFNFKQPAWNKLWWVFQKPASSQDAVRTVITNSPAVGLMTFAHVGAYSSQIATVNVFLLALLINFLLFHFIMILKFSVGLGATEAFHGTFNTVLLKFTGSILGANLI